MWLLAVAMPMQGLSAATMLACGSGHHDHMPSHMTGHVHHDEINDAHTHSRVSYASPQEHAGFDHTHAGRTSLDKGVSHKCSACASCCTNAVVPSQAVSFDAVKLTDFFAPLVARTLAAYVTEGLERPPRPFLA